MSILDRRSRRAFWQQMVGKQVESGLSVGKFCAARKLSEASFYQWKKKLQATSESNVVVPVKIIEHQLAQQPGQVVRISTPSGFVLRVDAAMPMNVLAELLRCIESSQERGDLC